MKKLLILTFISLLATPVLAEAKLELGFNGNIVANHWNPLRFTSRDEKAAVLVLKIDQGNLREGSNIVSYSFSIPRSYGISIFEDDIFIPKWQKFSWQLLNEEEVLASGSFDRRLASPGKMTLIISANPSKWFKQSDERAINAPSNSLTKRLASYDGISKIIIDGSAPAPSPESIIAAATAGAQVALVEPLPASHADLLSLAPYKTQRLGAGVISRAEGLNKPATIDFERVFENFVSNNAIKAPKSKPQMPIIIALVVYAVLIVGLIILGQKAAVLTALSLSLLAAILSWTYLSPKAVEIKNRQALHLAAGDLAKEYQLTTIFSLRGSRASLRGQGYPLEHIPFSQLDGLSRFDIPRWQDVKYSYKPVLSRALLLLEKDKITNRSKFVFRDVFIKGLGFLDDLPPGTAIIRKAEDHQLPKSYEGLLAPLEDGTAIARYGNNILIAMISQVESP